MSEVMKCPSCAAVMPASASVCPHCVRETPRRSGVGKFALGLLGGLGASMTLMACYGAPPCADLPDGGSRCDFTPVVRPDGGTPDGGAAVVDGGRSDGGASVDGGEVRDGGADGGP